VRHRHLGCIAKGDAQSQRNSAPPNASHRGIPQLGRSALVERNGT
jgi:hypothetical protein